MCIPKVQLHGYEYIYNEFLYERGPCALSICTWTHNLIGVLPYRQHLSILLHLLAYVLLFVFGIGSQKYIKNTLWFVNTN